MTRVVFAAAVVLTVMLFIVAAVRASGDGGGSDEEVGFTVEWKEGFRVESADGQFKLKFGGRLQNDWMWGSGDDELEDAVGEIVSGNEFRRARLFFSGTVFSNVEFKVQYDFTGGDVDFKDVYLGITNLPFGTLRIGHFKEPFSLLAVQKHRLCHPRPQRQRAPHLGGGRLHRRR